MDLRFRLIYLILLQYKEPQQKQDYIFLLALTLFSWRQKKNVCHINKPLKLLHGRARVTMLLCLRYLLQALQD